MFETRIVRCGDQYFIEKKYIGRWTFMALLLERIPRRWERWSYVPFPSIEAAMSVQAVANRQLALLCDGEVVEPTSIKTA